MQSELGNNKKRNGNKPKEESDDDESNAYGLTELMRAAKNSRDPAVIVEMLALQDSKKHKETLFATDVKGRTALDWARMTNNTFAVAVLQKAMQSYIYNARLQEVDAVMLKKPPTAIINRRQTKELFDALRRRDGDAALHVLYENKLYRQEVNSFQEEYFIDCQDQFGFTPLILAAGMNMIDVVSKLIELDVEIDHKNRFGHTALTWACSTGHAEIVRILLFNGANIHHLTNEGRTGLHYACIYTKSGVVNVIFKYFLERFAIHQSKAQYQTFDRNRFTHYAHMLEEFINTRDKKQRKAEDLLQMTTYVNHDELETKAKEAEGMAGLSGKSKSGKRKSGKSRSSSSKLLNDDEKIVSPTELLSLKDLVDIVGDGVLDGGDLQVATAADVNAVSEAIAFSPRGINAESVTQDQLNANSVLLSAAADSMKSNPKSQPRAIDAIEEGNMSLDVDSQRDSENASQINDSVQDSFDHRSDRSDYDSKSQRSELHSSIEQPPVERSVVALDSSLQSLRSIGSFDNFRNSPNFDISSLQSSALGMDLIGFENSLASEFVESADLQSMQLQQQMPTNITADEFNVKSSSGSKHKLVEEHIDDLREGRGGSSSYHINTEDDQEVVLDALQDEIGKKISSSFRESGSRLQSGSKSNQRVSSGSDVIYSDIEGSRRVSIASDTISDITLSSAFDTDHGSTQFSGSNRSSFSEIGAAASGRRVEGTTAGAAEQAAGHINNTGNDIGIGAIAKPDMIDGGIDGLIPAVNSKQLPPTHSKMTSGRFITGPEPNYLRNIGEWNEYCRLCTTNRQLPEKVQYVDHEGLKKIGERLEGGNVDTGISTKDKSMKARAIGPTLSLKEMLEANPIPDAGWGQGYYYEDDEPSHGVDSDRLSKVGKSKTSSKSARSAAAAAANGNEDSNQDANLVANDNEGADGTAAVAYDSDTSGTETPSVTVSPSNTSSRANSAFVSRENEFQRKMTQKISGLVHAIKQLVGSYGDNIVAEDDENMLAAAATMLVPPLKMKQIGDDSDGDDLIGPPPASPTTEIAEIRRVLSHVKDHIANWRAHGEREFELSQPTPCWLECGFVGPLETIYKHITMGCPHKAIECADCCTFIRQIDYKQHCLRLCLKRQVSCPNCIRGCAETVRFDEKEVHLHLQCKYRDVPCRLGCGAVIYCKDREYHEAEHCKHRLVNCDLCKQQIRSYQISEHLHSLCPERSVKCRVGCGLFVLAKDLEDHEQFKCTMPCRWGCGELIGPIGNRRNHETVLCKSRPIVCANPGCTIKGLTAKYADEHQNKQCLYRLQVCAAGCGMYISRREQPMHIDPWHGTCTERMVRCPSNLIGWRVRHRDDIGAGFGIVLKYKRIAYVENSRTSQWADGEDKVYIRFENKQIWCNPWKEPLILVERALGVGIDDTFDKSHPFDCDWISFSKLNNHLEHTCRHRNIWVQAVSDVSMAIDVLPSEEQTLSMGSQMLNDALNRTNKMKVDHTAEGDGGRNEDVASWALIKKKAKNKSKTYGGGKRGGEGGGAEGKHKNEGNIVAIQEGNEEDDNDEEAAAAAAVDGRVLTLPTTSSIAEQIEDLKLGSSQHAFQSNPNSRRNSNVSGTLFFDDAGCRSSVASEKENLEDLQSEPDAIHAEKPIGFYVGQQTTADKLLSTLDLRKKLDAFVGSDVPIASCDDCGELVPLVNMQNHLKYDCSETVLRCKNGCGSLINRRYMARHVSSECSKRLVICELCSDSTLEIWAEELDSHKKDLCKMRPYDCQLGCGIAGLVFCTEEEHRASKCPNRTIRCMCGMLMKECEYEVHKIADCSEVQTLCPQGCGVYIKKDLVDYHLEKTCANKSFFFLKYVYCALGCGRRIMKKDVLEHVTYHCEKRLTECPFNCGNSVQYCRLEQHIYFCPMRRLACEPGMNTCETYVKRWFYSLEGENGLSIDDIINEEYVDDDDGLTISTSFPSVPVTAHNIDMTSTIQGTNSLLEGSYANALQLFDPSQSTSINDDLAAGPSLEESTISNISGRTQELGKRSDAEQLKTPLLLDENAQIEAKTQTIVAGAIVKKKLYLEKLRQQQELLEKDTMSVVSIASSNTIASTKQPYKHGTIAGKVVLPAVVVRDGVVIPLDNLRLCRCRRHGNTLLMSAIRFDDIVLTEFIIKRTGGLDIDIENSTGDTALTLACRLGKLQFVELLVQNGADVNLETSTGRTPLIEAVKAPNSVEISLYLTQNGAIVRYKTQKHGHTAMKWARRMGLVDTMRVLELALVVQREIIALFNAISCGDQAKVLNLVGPGEVFDPNGESKLYVMMEEQVKQARIEDKEARELREKAGNLTTQIEETRESVQIAEKEVEFAKQELSSAAEELDGVSVNINDVFVTYERACNRLLASDIEELLRLRKLDEVLCISLYALGILFGFLSMEDCPNVMDKTGPNRCFDDAINRSNIWWPNLSKLFESPENVIRSFKLFTLDKFQGIHGAKLLQRVPNLLAAMKNTLIKHNPDILKLVGTKKFDAKTMSPTRRQLSSTAIAIQEEAEEDEDEDGAVAATRTTATAAAVATADTDVDEQSDASSTASASSLTRSNKKASATTITTTTTPTITSITVWDTSQSKTRAKKLQSIARAKQEQALAAKDDGMDEYDSDTDEAWTGKWVKGKWIAERVYKNKDKVATKKGKEKDESKHRPSSPNDFANMTLQQYKELVSKVEATAAATTATATATTGTSSPIGVLSKQSSAVGFLSARSNSDNSLNNTKRRLSRRETMLLQQQELERLAKEAERQAQLEQLTVKDVFVSAALGELDDSSIGGLLIPQVALSIYTLLIAGNKLFDQQIEIARIKSIYIEKGRNLTIAQEVLKERQLKFDSLEEQRTEVEKNLVKMKKLARFTLDRARRYREKLRVWRLLNQVTASGHTAISWAASRGNFEAMDAMLLHGASVGFTSSLIHLSATYIQYSFRLYKLLYKQQKKAVLSEKDPNAAFLLDEENKAANGLSVVEQISQIKEKRSRVLHKMSYQKRKIRLPMPEAAYAGKYEIVRRIYDRRMYHDHYAHSWCSASPAVPYRRTAAMEMENTRVTNSNSLKTHMWDLLLQGERDLGAGRYDGDVGWILRGDQRDFHGEGKIALREVMDLVEERKEKKRAERKRVRAIVNERKARHIGEEGMYEAMKKGDFKKVMWLVQNGSISIDWECPDGRTPLIVAAEENIVLPTHEYILNDDGTPCLLVEFMLDREMYRAAVNLESHTHGWTALIRAAMLSRRHVLQALLDRGANVNHINKHGKTALHYAAQTGDLECTRILMERGINPDVKDNEGHTAFEIAEDMGFLNIMMKISQYRAGYMGNVRVTRGMVEDTIKCPLGCGLNISPHESRYHVLECPYRIVECPQGCGIRLLQARECEDHCLTICGRRVIVCYDCQESYNLADEEYHRNHVCRTRVLQCVNGCGSPVRWCDIEKHQAICTWRPTECPQKCGMTLPFIQSYEHCKTDCKRRRINCPQQCLAWIMWMNLDHHMRDTCPCRPVECPFCKEIFPLRTCKEHEDVCELRAELCKAKCGELVPVKFMKEHLRDTCVNRPVPCELGCGLKVRLCDMTAHTENDCVNRLVPCPLGCLVDENAPLIHLQVHKYQAKEIKFHVVHDCPKRSVVCTICAQPIQANVLEQHKSEECPLRLIHCTNPGCLKNEVAKNFDRHLRFECRFRLEPCVQGCGILVQNIRMGKHVLSDCMMRHVPCPLQCGMNLRYNLMVSHLDNECSRRFNKAIHQARQAYMNGLSFNGVIEEDAQSSSKASSPNSRSSSMPSSPLSKSRPNTGASTTSTKSVTDRLGSLTSSKSSRSFGSFGSVEGAGSELDTSATVALASGKSSRLVTSGKSSRDLLAAPTSAAAVGVAGSSLDGGILSTKRSFSNVSGSSSRPSSQEKLSVSFSTKDLPALTVSAGREANAATSSSRKQQRTLSKLA